MDEVNHYELTDEDREMIADRKRDDRFLDLAAAVAIGAQAIHEKRRLQVALAEMTESRDKWMALCQEGDAARQHILGDLVVGLGSGLLKVDRGVPLPERFKEKA